MSAPGFWDDRETAEGVGKQFGDLKRDIEEWTSLKEDAEAVASLIADMDEGDADDIEGELKSVEQRYAALEVQLMFSGRYDGHGAVVSIHAGVGGVDAQDWSEMLLRMYLRFCEQQGFETELVHETRGTEAGIKSATVRIMGMRAYGHLRAEAGTHRLVRQSPFNADGLRQTSFALVDVVPEIEEDIEGVEIDPNDLRVDTYMSSGKGGQSVNTTYSAVRIVHEPTGITVTCQNERSQSQNKETALRILRGRLLQRKIQEQQETIAGIRGDVSSAEWGSQIRSYVLHPYKLVKDHRTGHETSDVDAVLDGALLPFIHARLTQLMQV